MNFAAESPDSRKPVRLPLTPLIDVFFLLLVYFVVSSSLTQPEEDLSAALRQENQEASASDLQPQYVEVRPGLSGTEYVVGSRVLRSQGELRDVLAQLPKEAGVFLKVDDRAPVWAAAAALQACHDAGYEKLTYVTK